MLIMIFGLMVSACTNDIETPEDTLPMQDQTFRLLMEAEDLSGMADMTKSVITTNGSLNLPTEYLGVQITYSSRNKDIIDNDGNVTRPNECWIESRDQQGIAKEAFENLNDNWPVVVDVTLTFQGQTRTAKLLFVVAPENGFTCNKYLG